MGVYLIWEIIALVFFDEQERFEEFLDVFLIVAAIIGFFCLIYRCLITI